MQYIGDTDSLKLKKGFDEKIIINYHTYVTNTIEKVANLFGFDLDMYKPKDQNGKEHLIGILECDGIYNECLFMSSKKYIVEKTIDNNKVNPEFQKTIKKYENKSKVLEITVAGVPKKAVKQLKSIDDFTDDLVFEYKYTGKNMLVYVDEQEPIILIDFNRHKEKVYDMSGCCLIPINHTLNESIEYEHLLSDDSSKRARYNE